MEEQIPSVPTPVPTVSPVPVESKKKSKLPIIVISLIVISLIAVAGVMFGMQIEKRKVKVWTEPPLTEVTPKPTSNNTPQVITETITEKPTGTVDETANWKTYKNDEYGFEFKYPPELKVEETGDIIQERIASDCLNIKVGLMSLRIKTPRGVNGGCVLTGMGINNGISIVSEKNKLSGQEYNFDGNLVDYSNDPDSKYKYDEYLRLENIPETDFIIEYGGGYNPDQINIYNQDKTQIKQILSTFKFTNSSN